MRRILIDSGLLLNYYPQQEPLPQAVVAFLDQNAAQLITLPIWIAELHHRRAGSPICIAEVPWRLGDP